MDTHQWRSAPYQPQPCPVCFYPHYPYCSPAPAYVGSHLQQPHPYPAPLPPPKRMRVEDSYRLDHTLNRIPPKEDRMLNLIRDHGRQGDSQDPGIGSYQNYHVHPNVYSNPYNNPYQASQVINQSYRPVPSYGSTSAHPEGYYGYNRLEDGYGYPPDPSQSWAQAAPPPPPPPPHGQPEPPPPPPPPLPHNPLDSVPHKNSSLFPIVSSGSGRTVPLPSTVYGFAETNPSLPLKQVLFCIPAYNFFCLFAYKIISFVSFSNFK